MIDVRDFLAKVEEIAGEEPGYQHGHSGDDQLCDCIGLIIGAIRRAGGQWHGTHGSNYAARREVRELRRITRAADLTAGDLVFKAYEPSDKGYSLPGRYREGGSSYTGDLRDYYHVGVVLSVRPLRIRHMTTPRPKMDTSLGKWGWYGWPRMVAGQTEIEEEIPVGNLVQYQAKVIGDGMLNMRKEPDARAARIMQLPVGTVVDVCEEDGDWRKITYAGKTGYVMGRYLETDTATGAMITVDRTVLEALYDELGNLLGLRG